MRRTDRLKTAEVKRPSVNIAQLSVVLEDPDRLRQKQTVISQEDEEEASQELYKLGLVDNEGNVR